MVFEHGSALPESRNTVNQEQGKTRVCDDGKPVDDVSRDRFRKDPFRSDQPASQQSKRVGYIRVSTTSQLTDRQTMQLEAECDELRIEHVSAIAAERPVFDHLLEELTSGDTFVVLDLDRAFRSAIDAILTGETLRERGIHFQVLSLPVDTASEEGALFYNILACFADFERRIISRRTKEGLEAARRRGVKLGRPAQLSEDVILNAHEWMTEANLPCRYVAALLGVSRLTLQRGFKKLGLS